MGKTYTKVHSSKDVALKHERKLKARKVKSIEKKNIGSGEIELKYKF